MDFIHILNDHKLWLDTKCLLGKRANLEGLNLSGVDIGGAWLDDKNSIWAIRREKILKNVSRSEINLKGIDLRWAILKKTIFKGANLEGANLEGARLENSNLRCANLENIDLKHANLEEAKLEGARLIGANLENADLRWSILKNSDLKGANLKGANFEGAILIDAKLGCVNLADVKFKKTRLEGAKGILQWQAPQGDKKICYSVKHNNCIMHQLGDFWGDTDSAITFIRKKYGDNSLYERFLLLQTEALVNE